MLNADRVNVQLISLLMILYATNAYRLLTATAPCNATAVGIITAGMAGYIAGYFWFKILHRNNQDSLLYYTEFVSDKTVCTKPKKTQFKCSMYKNGELVTTFTPS
tara:strand:- start:165 stop:479 length:315 start_codon:yes stop_codon:yes gene_type:complete